MSDQPAQNAHEMDLELLKASAHRRLRRRDSGSGVLTFPAIPSLKEHYQRKLLDAFALLGRPFNEEEAQKLGEMLGQLMNAAFERSPYARVTASYQTDPNPDLGISYEFRIAIISVADKYDAWAESRPQPFFGANPNAKVLDLARSLGAPARVPILDVGAAEGRNTLPLARAGFPTDAVEIAPEFAKLLRQNLAQEKLPGEVFSGDVLDPALPIPENHYALVVMAGVLVAHVRDSKHLRAVIERASASLKPGGMLLFSIFVTQGGFEPDREIRELAELFWTVMFTPRELAQATAGLPLELVDDISYVDYERRHMPEAWPPTTYFEAYCAAQDLFDLPAGRAPLEMRWLTYRKR